MDYRETFVKLFTDAAQDKPSRPSVQVIDGYWTLAINGNKDKWSEMITAACVPHGAEQTITEKSITIRWPSVADQIFADGGLMAQALPGYETRLPQLHMARLIQRAIEMGEPAIIEAGTGTGKSFAYAAVCMAMNKRVVISTSNKALQGQLYQKDIPFLCRLFPGKKVALAQGKNNYLCRAKCQDANDNITIDNYSLAEWYKTTESGNTEELDFKIYGLDTWTIDEECTGKRCKFYASCFYYKARQERLAADVVICNHALLILDRLYPQANILPGCDVVVVDEAHKLTEYARGALGEDFAIGKVSDALSTAMDFGADTADAERHLQTFWQEVGDLAPDPKNADRQIGINHELEFASGIKLADEMHEVADQVWNPEDTPESRDEVRRAKRADKIRNLADRIQGVSLPTVAGRVRWLEPEGWRLFNVPFDVSEFVGRMAGFSTESAPHHDRTRCARCGRALSAAVYVLDGLGYGPDCIRYVDAFGDAEVVTMAEWQTTTEQPIKRHEPTAIIFTSATIAAPSLDHFMRDCGIQHGFQMVADSPFDYESSAILYTPNGETPTPNTREWQAYMIEDVRRLVMAAGGGAFLLFTSNNNMRYAAQALRGVFESAGMPVYVQGELPKGEIAKRFRADGNAVLFATKSFWEGVSIEGEALRLVVIDKLPFAAPSPLSKARETTVKNPFMDLQVPEMIIDLKQGCGRLIRNMTDWGALAILDPRVRLKPYGRTQVVPALPPAKYTHRMGEVEEFFHQRRTASVITSPKDVTMGVPYYLEELEELGF